MVIGMALALGAIPKISLMLLGFALGLFLSSSAMIFNDFFDLEVDRINSPHRPLPSGKLTMPEVISFGMITAIIAWIIAFVINPLVLVICLILWFLGFLYNWKLKAAGIWGNLIVSINVAMTFILGGISAGQVSNPLVWIFGLIAFFFDLGEEIAGDAMDMEGDKKRASKSLAILYGKNPALRISAISFGIVILLTLLPIWMGETSLAYIIPILAMDLIIIFLTDRLLKAPTPHAGRAAMRGLYISTTIGLIAFTVSRFLG